MEYKRSEIGAGIFLLVSFAVLAIMIFAVSDIQSLFKKKKDVKALFLFSDGIEKNAQVRFSGIKIGKVTNIRVAAEYGDKVELTLSIFDDMAIKEDARANIRTLGLVGGKYVELSGGSPKARPIPPGGTLIGEESLKLEDLTKAGLEVVGKLKQIAGNLEHMAGNLDRILGDPALDKTIKTVLHNVQDTTANLKVMTSSKEEIAQALKNLPETLKKIDDATNNLKAVTEKTDKIVGENKKNIDEMIQHFRDMGKNLKDASEEIKEAPWKLLRKP